MKLRISAVILTAVFFSLGTISHSTAANNFAAKKSTKEITISPPEKTFTVGEKLLFDAYWYGIHVGVGSLEVTEKVRMDGRDAFHIVAVAETNDFLTKLYPVRDVIETYIDDQEYYSLEFRKTVKEGFYRADEKIHYDYNNKKGLYESLHNKSKKEFPLPSHVQDFLSAFYWARLQNWEVGKGLHTVVNDDEKNWDLEVEIQRTEAKEIRNRGIVDTVVVEPKTRMKGMLYKRGRAWVYFSADSRRYPVLIFIETPFGPITGVLRQEKAG